MHVQPDACRPSPDHAALSRRHPLKGSGSEHGGTDIPMARRAEGTLRPRALGATSAARAPRGQVRALRSGLRLQAAPWSSLREPPVRPKGPARLGRWTKAPGTRTENSWPERAAASLQTRPEPVDPKRLEAAPPGGRSAPTHPQVGPMPLRGSAHARRCQGLIPVSPSGAHIVYVIWIHEM